MFWIIIVTLITLIIGQSLIEVVTFYFLCKLHYLEFKRVRMQMFSVLASQIFFYIFALLFILEWNDQRGRDESDYFSYWDLACPLTKY